MADTTHVFRCTNCGANYPLNKRRCFECESTEHEIVDSLGRVIPPAGMVTISIESLRQLVAAGVLVQLITPWLKDDYLKEKGYDHNGIDKALEEAGHALGQLD